MPLEPLALGSVFIATMSLTPGPANLSCLSVGASMGIARALPYLAGIWLGGAVVIGAGAMGLGALLASAPLLFLVMKVAGFFYICWLAWRLARAGFGGAAHDAPPSFWAGLLLHPVNPKAYVQNVMVFTAFIAPAAPYVPQAIWLGGISLLLMVIATTLWGLGGEAIRNFIRNARSMRVFAGGASTLMVASVAAAFAF